MKRLPALLAIYRDRGYDFRQDIYDVNIDIVPAPDEGKAKIAFQTFDDAEIHYTLDGSVPDVQSHCIPTLYKWIKMLSYKPLQFVRRVLVR